MRYLPAGVWIGCCAAAFAQPPQNEPTRIAFEVVSVKPDKSIDTNMSMNLAAGGQLNCTNATVRFLISFAYGVRD